MQRLAQYSQGIYVAGCALMSMGTLGWMISDSFEHQKRHIIKDYENKIKNLNDEINKFKMENSTK